MEGEHVRGPRGSGGLESLVPPPAGDVGILSSGGASAESGENRGAAPSPEEGTHLVVTPEGWSSEPPSTRPSARGRGAAGGTTAAPRHERSCSSSSEDEREGGAGTAWTDRELAPAGSPKDSEAAEIIQLRAEVEDVGSHEAVFPREGSHEAAQSSEEEAAIPFDRGGGGGFRFLGDARAPRIDVIEQMIDEGPTVLWLTTSEWPLFREGAHETAPPESVLSQGRRGRHPSRFYFEGLHRSPIPLYERDGSKSKSSPPNKASSNGAGDSSGGSLLDVEQARPSSPARTPPTTVAGVTSPAAPTPPQNIPEKMSIGTPPDSGRWGGSSAPDSGRWAGSPSAPSSPNKPRFLSSSPQLQQLSSSGRTSSHQHQQSSTAASSVVDGYLSTTSDGGGWTNTSDVDAFGPHSYRTSRSTPLNTDRSSKIAVGRSSTTTTMDPRFGGKVPLLDFTPILKMREDRLIQEEAEKLFREAFERDVREGKVPLIESRRSSALLNDAEVEKSRPRLKRRGSGDKTKHAVALQQYFEKMRGGSGGSAPGTGTYPPTYPYQRTIGVDTSDLGEPPSERDGAGQRKKAKIKVVKYVPSPTHSRSTGSTSGWSGSRGRVEANQPRSFFYSFVWLLTFPSRALRRRSERLEIERAEIDHKNLLSVPKQPKPKPRKNRLPRRRPKGPTPTQQKYAALPPDLKAEVDKLGKDSSTKLALVNAMFGGDGEAVPQHPAPPIKRAEAL